jgi:hypothetical protein
MALNHANAEVSILLFGRIEAKRTNRGAEGISSCVIFADFFPAGWPKKSSTI